MSASVPAAGAPARVDLARAFMRWSFARGLCARGYWLVASVYLVVVARLSPSELVFVGTGQALVVLVAEIPAGVFADTFSRKWSIVLAHVITGAGIVLTGLVTAFPALVVSQSLWGLGWAFANGADVAWITDELDQPERIDRVLAARARWDLVGAAAGLVLFGGVAAVTTPATAIVGSGVAFAALGILVAVRLPERRFRGTPAASRWRQAGTILRGGVRLARGDREILLLTLAWLLVNGGGEGYGRLVERRLITLGFASGGDAVGWFAGLGLGTLIFGACTLRVAERRIDRQGSARGWYLACCVTGTVGILIVASAPSPSYAVAAVIIASGAAHPGAVLRAVGEIWVNRRTTREVRATVHSLLSQAEHLGELTFGLMLAEVAQSGGMTMAFVAAALILATAGAIVSRLCPTACPP